MPIELRDYITPTKIKIMEPIHTEIELKKLVLNTGQIEGLPALCGSRL